MGKTPGKPRRNVSDRPDFLVLIENFAATATSSDFENTPRGYFTDLVFTFYELREKDQFLELMELIGSYACRDQDEEAASVPMADRRARGYEAAIAMRDNAAAAIKCLEAIHAAQAQFDQATGMLPSLLEEVFDVDTGPPDNLFLPKPIMPLQDFLTRRNWDEIDDELMRLVNMPIRPKLSRGPVPNLVLRHALVACRHYWRTNEGRSWSMSSLKSADVRYENKPGFLQGECEAFVSDALRMSGVRFNLYALATAWTWVDAHPELVPAELTQSSGPPTESSPETATA